MTEDTTRPFCRFYAQLLQEAGQDVPDPERRDRDALGVPKVANPRPGSAAESR